MTKQRESRLSGRIRQALNDLPETFSFKIHGSETMLAGLPDLLVCRRGLFLGVETKMPESRSNLSERQKYVHELIRGAGGDVVVACSVEEAVGWIESFGHNLGTPQG